MCKSDKFVFGVASLLGILVLAGLINVATHISIEYWDGYDYLNNALALTGRSGFVYDHIRPPLVSIFNALPLYWYKPAGAGLAVSGPHVISLLLAALSLLAVYKLLRLSFASALSLWGVALLSLSLLFIHFSVFVTTDIPGMLFLTLGFIYYLSARIRRLDEYLSTIFFAMAFLTRYTHMLALAVLITFEISKAYGDGMKPYANSKSWSLRKLLIYYQPQLRIVVNSLAIFYLTHVLLYLRLGKGWKALLDVFVGLRLQLFASQNNTILNPVTGHRIELLDPIAEYPLELIACFTLPIFMLALVGAYRSWVKRRDIALLSICWFGVFFFFLTFVAKHREARYLFSIIPSFLYFVLHGVQYLIGSLQYKKLRTAIICLLLILPLKLAINEFRRFDDPVYSRPLMTEVAKTVLGSHDEIYYSGFVYTFYPKDHVFVPYDDFTYNHHLGVGGLHYWLDKNVKPLKAGAQGTVIKLGDQLYFAGNASEAPEPPAPLKVSLGDVEKVFHYR